MSRHHARSGPRLRRRRASRPNPLVRAFALIAAGCFLASGLLLAGVGGRGKAQADTASGQPSFTASKTMTRTHLIDGKDSTVDTRTVDVTANVTKDLKLRQAVHITWTGAHPTGGVVYDANSQYAVDQEYPVAVLQCRGTEAEVTPETCYTQTPNERYEPAIRGNFPPYRLDRYATAANRVKSVGAPNPLPDTCLFPDGADHWVPMVAADGTSYPGGYNGCAGLAPDQSAVINALSPPNTTFAATAADGTGSTDFVIQNSDSNSTLGCSATVACSIVVIPIMGISCDATAASLPATDQPPAGEFVADQSACTATGQFAATAPGDQSHDFPSDMAVSGQLWWSASNWQNRITIPISLASGSAVCDIVGGGAPEAIYGSEALAQLTQQWAPKFCLDSSLFRLQHVQVSEVQAKNLLAGSVINGQYAGIKAAFQAGPPAAAFRNPIVQAPTSVSGWGIAFTVDDAKHHKLTSLKLNARLLAKLLSMSYPAFTNIREAWSRLPLYEPLQNNPLDIVLDPEFLALNPGARLPAGVLNQVWASSTLFAMSSDSDVMTALTSYLASDPDARAFLAGTPDPWGMRVNPYYNTKNPAGGKNDKLTLPTTSWPLLDPTYIDVHNDCISDAKAPILPLIAAPVSDPSLIPFNLQYDISNSQVDCVFPTGSSDASTRRLASEGREQAGIRFLLGVVSLGDAARYDLNVAALQTQSSVGAGTRFTDDGGRTFVAPTSDSLLAAAKLLQPDQARNTWTMPYDRLRTDPAAAGAYPGTLLMSTDVPTIGLPAGDATNLAKFLTYAAGPGQVAGTGNGQLPNGYLPLTSANGLSDLVDFTTRAVAEVQRQQGRVPLVGGGYSSLTPPSSGSTTPAGSGPAGSPGTSTGSSAGSDGGAANPGSIDQGGPSDSPAPSAPGPAAQPASTSVSPSASAQAVPTALTTQVRPGWTAFVIPVLAILGLLSAGASAWLSGVGRR